VKSQNPETRKGGACRFSQDLYRRTKGPVDPSKGFQQEPKGPFQLREENDPETERSQNPAKVGGLHQVVSEHQFFVCRLQAKEEKKETENSELYSMCDK
jgi:hypothetical protein